MNALDFFARWRVRLGYLVAVVVLLLSRPSPQSLWIGGLVGLLGLALRAYAAGFLHKQEILTTTGPYAYTRNPLYFGSSLLTLGAGIAMRSWLGGFLLLIYFALVYSLVMKREAQELRGKHGAAFDRYADSVPLFFPQIRPRRAGEPAGAFSRAQYRKNHEYQAAVGFVLLLLGLLAIWYFRSVRHG